MLNYPSPERTTMDFCYDDVSTALPHLMQAILVEGANVPSRVGQTRELIHQHVTLRHPWRREVLTPGRNASLPAQIAETMWVLAGRDDVEWLARYMPRAPQFSDDGETWRGAYGPRLRSWSTYSHIDGSEYEPASIDQLAHVVQLLKKDPASRRAVMTIYDPAIDSADGKDIPCNNWLHFQIRDDRLYLHVTIRSNDLMWGWSGINAFEWSALQEIVAGLLGVQQGELHFSISSPHLYDRHWSKAGRIAAAPQAYGYADSPRYRNDARDLEDVDALISRWFRVESDIRSGDYSGIEAFPEPMLRSWLRVIAWWWSKDLGFLDQINGTALEAAAMLTPKPKPVAVESDPFTEFVVNLHTEKDAVYGNSWKKRGEQISILANIARKVDRLGVAGAGDTAADTVIDLLVYLVKYRLWMDDPDNEAVGPVNDWIRSAPRWGVEPEPVIANLIREFDTLQGIVSNLANMSDWEARREDLVDKMIPQAAAVARALWLDEQWAAGNAKRAWNPEA